MSDPIVTFCTPSFNRADLIAQTLESMIAQTFSSWEAIVVDDGSAPEALAVVRAYSARDSRIKLIQRNRGPKGACTCRNIAVDQAAGRYVMFLDTDDVLAPHCLAQRTAVLDENPALDFAIFPTLVFSGTVESADRIWNVDTDEGDLERLLRLDWVCGGTGTLWRKESFVRVGKWNEHLSVWQDVDLHLRALTSRMQYVKKWDLAPDVYLRETDGSLSRGAYHSTEKLESRAAVARTAVTLLRRHRPDLVRHARFICASVILGAAAAGHVRLAAETRLWAKSQGVFSVTELIRLQLAEMTARLHADRVRPVRTIRRRLVSVFDSPSTLGQISYSAQLRDRA